MTPELRRPGSVTRYTGRTSAGALGVAGSVVCGASMVLVGVGVGVSAGATGMAAMSGTGVGAPNGVLGVLLRIGPWLLVVSVLLVTATFGTTRRPATALLALLAGVVLYAGMYLQPNLVVMYVSIAIGYAAWGALYLWVRRARPGPARFTRDAGLPTKESDHHGGAAGDPDLGRRPRPLTRHREQRRNAE